MTDTPTPPAVQTLKWLREQMIREQEIGVSGFEDWIERIDASLLESGKVPDCAAFLAMSEADFCAAFVKHMVAVAGEKFDDGSSIADYAAETAPTYWANEDQRQDGPEECADADMSYWEE